MVSVSSVTKPRRFAVRVISALGQVNSLGRNVVGKVAASRLNAISRAKGRSSELKIISWSPKSPMVSNLGTNVDINQGLKNCKNSSLETLGIYRADSSAQVIRTFETANVRLDLLNFEKQNSMELEIRSPLHSVILLIDGLSKGCEWSDERQSGRSSFLAPNTVMFNPAQNYLRVRANILQNRCHMLLLAIQPGVMKWRDDLEIDLAAVRFRQQIGLNDEQATKTLLAIEQELEAPGLYGAFCIEALLFLLLTRLIRRVSNLAEASEPTYAKGGLPNWRLKRAIGLLENEVAKKPTLAEVARVIGLHPTSFCRAFKRSTGLSPHRYILAHRVNRAKEMMKDQRLSLTEIALDCGFSGSSQFSVVFRRIAGMAPREFRRAL